MAYRKQSIAAVGERTLADRGDGLVSGFGKVNTPRRCRPGSWRGKAYKKIAREIRLATKAAMYVEYIEQQRDIVAKLVINI